MRINTFPREGLTENAKAVQELKGHRKKISVIHWLALVVVEEDVAFISDAWLAVVGEVPFTISRRRRRSGGRDILSDLGDLGDGRGCGGGRGSEAGGFGGGGGGGRIIYSNRTKGLNGQRKRKKTTKRPSKKSKPEEEPRRRRSQKAVKAIKEPLKHRHG
eukprot:191686_1